MQTSKGLSQRTISTILVATLAVLCLQTSAQQEIVIFRGDRPANSGLSLGSWGSGDIRETGEAVYIGSTSLQVITQSFYQGGRIALQQPANLGALANDPYAYLQFYVRLPRGTGSMYGGYVGGMLGGAPRVPGMPGVGGVPGAPRMPGVPGVGGAPGMGGPRVGTGAGRVGGPAAGAGRAGRIGGGMMGGPPIGGPNGDLPPGAGGLGGRTGATAGGRTGAMGGYGLPGFGAGRTYTAPATAMSIMKQMRVVIVTADNRQYEAVAPFEPPLTDEEGWFPIGVALKAFKGMPAGAQIKEIRVFGDAYGVFYVGEIRVATDSTPITGDAGDEQIVAANDLVRLEARAGAGITPLRYSWDFDARDGIQEDAVGKVVTTRYRKPGEYTVTLTVTDVYGLKKPFISTTKITVNE